MKCPSCHSADNTKALWLQTITRRLPKRFSAYNIQRRERECIRCGHRFFSIEMEEKDWLHLIERAMRVA